MWDTDFYESQIYKDMFNFVKLNKINECLKIIRDAGLFDCSKESSITKSEEILYFLGEEIQIRFSSNLMFHIDFLPFLEEDYMEFLFKNQSKVLKNKISKKDFYGDNFIDHVLEVLLKLNYPDIQYTDTIKQAVKVLYNSEIKSY